MSSNPVSFRFPFESQISDMPPEHQGVIRTVWNAITDLQGAIPLLKTQIDAKVSKTTSSSTSSTSSSSSSGSSETATTASVTKAIASAVSALKFSLKASSPGGVNNQTGNTTYATVQSDYGKAIVFNDASAIALSLSVTASLPGITLPWYCVVINEGAGSVTVTPVSGQINGASNLVITANAFGMIFYDGTNFFACSASEAGSGVTSLDGITGAITLVAGAGITITNGSPSAQDITIASSSSSGYLKGTVTIAFAGATTGHFSGTGTVTGATTSMSAVALVPPASTTGGNALIYQSWLNVSVTSANTVTMTADLQFPNAPVGLSTVTFTVIVFQ